MRLRIALLFVIITRFHLAQTPIIWDKISEAVATQTLISKNSGNNSYNSSGAVSGNILFINTSGYAEFKVNQLNKRLAFGFITNNKRNKNKINEDFDFELDDFRFCVELANGNKIKIYRNGKNVGQFGSYKLNDVIKLEKNALNNQIYLIKNNVQIAQINYSQDKEMRVMVLFKTENGSIIMPNASFIKPLDIQSNITEAFCNGLNKGAVSNTVSGGVAPYQFFWNDSPVSILNRNNLFPGEYTFTVNDNQYNTVSKLININSCVKWGQKTGAIETNGNLQKTANNGWGNAGARSVNVLDSKKQGFVEYIINETKNFAFGFNKNDSLLIDNWEDIDLGYLILQKRLFIIQNGNIIADIGAIKKNDKLKLYKDISNFQMFKNDILLAEIPLNDLHGKSLNVSVALFKKQMIISNLKASFYINRLNAHIEKNDVIEPNSGFISAKPFDGLPPYRYLWNTGSISQYLFDLSPGDYFVTIKDSLNDSLRVNVSLAGKINSPKLTNISIKNDELVLINRQQQGELSLTQSINANENGWYEFKLNNINTSFDFLITNSVNSALSSCEQNSIVRIGSVTNTVLLTGNQIPNYTSIEFKQLNFLSKQDFTSQPQSVIVYQNSIVDTKCKEEFRVPLTSYSGIAYGNGFAYLLVNGLTLNRGYQINEGDVLRLGRSNGSLYLSVNNNTIITKSFETNTILNAKIILNDYSAQISDILTNAKGISLIEAPIIYCPGDLSRNWDKETMFDEWGNIISESKTYFDSFGKITQNQNKNLTDNKIIVTQNVFDRLGRPVLTTLPAPISESEFCYKDNFITNQNGITYNYNDFDKSNYSSNPNFISTGEVDDPAAVQTTQIGTLGWYYSNNNTWDRYVGRTTTPFHRYTYSQTIPQNLLKSSLANPKLKNGSGHESYLFELNVAGELGYFYGALSGWRVYDLNNHFFNYSECKDVSDVKSLYAGFIGGSATKRVSVDQNGQESVEFYDLNGNLLASCLAGQVNGANQNLFEVKSYIDTDPNSDFKYVDIHLPKGCENSLKLDLGYLGSTNVFNIYDLKNEQYVKINGSIDIQQSNPTLPAGYYRVIAKQFDVSGLNTINIRHQLNYYNVTLNYYDLAGKLRITVPPKGFDNTFGISTSSPELPNNVTNNNVTNKFGLIDNSTSSSFSGLDEIIMPNWTIPTNPELNKKVIALNFNIPNVTNQKVLGTFITFSGKSSAVSPYFGNDQNGTNSGLRTISTSNAIVIEDNLFKPVYTMDSINYLKNETSWTLDAAGNKILTTNLSNNVVCTTTMVPVQFTYILKSKPNQFGFPEVPISSIETITGYCVLDKCSDGSFSKTWSFPPPKKYYSIPASNNGQLIQLRLEIISVKFIKTPNTPNFSTTLLNDVSVSMSSSYLYQTASPKHKMTEVFDYDSEGKVTISKSPDSGKNSIIYAQDGKRRFTQNSKQALVTAANGLPSQTGTKFSYTNYDEFDRPIETGEYHSAFNTGSNPTKLVFQDFYAEFDEPIPGVQSVKYLAANEQNVNENIRTTDRIFIVYDKADPNFYSLTGLSVNDYKQDFLNGEISYSYNENRKTWYSYDEDGRISWVVQKYENLPAVDGLNIKTFNYKYDLIGNLLEVIYQKENLIDKLVHYFEYDADKRLKRAFTLKNGTVKHLDAEYYYYLHGPLKRIELGNNLQGVDFVYTVDGWLKNINAPELDALHDPGKDGNLSSGKISYPDLFGQSLDYFDGDYERAGTFVQTYAEPQSALTNYAVNLYNQNVKAVRWQIKTPTNGIGLMAYQNKHLMYGYKYDEKYQLTEANFGTVDANGIQNQNSGESIVTEPSVPVVTFGNDYKVSDLTYDLNGNILSLKRNAYSQGTGGLAMDNLTYLYTNCTNKLRSVYDAVTPNTYGTFGFKSGQSSTPNYFQNVLGETTNDVNDNKNYEYNSRGLIKNIKDNAGNLIVEYLYDELGNRYHKNSYNGNFVTSTFYVRDYNGNEVAIYDKTLDVTSLTRPPKYKLKNLFISNSAKRIGTIDITNSDKEYNYELIDHIGNVRANFKEDLKTTLSFDFEDNQPDSVYFYDKDFSKFKNGVKFVSRVVAPNQKQGFSTYLIPVKPGDVIDASVYANYTGNLGATDAYLGIAITDINGNVLYDNSNNPFIVPMEHNTYVDAQSNNAWAQLVNSYIVPNTAAPLLYAKIYVYNQSTTPVFFDNISVIFSGVGAGIKTPKQLDAYSYYPHGSILPGLNYNIGQGNRYTYQGKYAENDKEVNEQFFELRNYNPLLGRFNTLDPYNQFHSPYLAMANNPNGVDPDGGNWLSFGVGAAGGAIVGAAVGFSIAKFSGQSKQGQIESTLWGAGAGAIVGGAVLGLTTDARWVMRGGHNGQRYFKKMKFSGRNGSHFKGFKGRDNFSFGRSKTPTSGGNFGFAFGFRTRNFVIFDVRLNFQNKAHWKTNFPGRNGNDKFDKWRFQMFYKIERGESGYYNLLQGGIPHGFFGGYHLFSECPDYTWFGGSSHRTK